MCENLRDLRAKSLDTFYNFDLKDLEDLRDRALLNSVGNVLEVVRNFSPI